MATVLVSDRVARRSDASAARDRIEAPNEQPLDAALMTARLACRLVNSLRNVGPALFEPDEPLLLAS